MLMSQVELLAVWWAHSLMRRAAEVEACQDKAITFVCFSLAFRSALSAAACDNVHMLIRLVIVMV